VRLARRMRRRRTAEARTPRALGGSPNDPWLARPGCARADATKPGFPRSCWRSSKQVHVEPGRSPRRRRHSRTADVRDVLPLVQAPHGSPVCCNRRADACSRQSTFLAEQIPECAGLAGPFPAADNLLRRGDTEVGRDSSRSSSPARAPVVVNDPAFAGQPVLFTDIVGSTERARPASGDPRLESSLLDTHDRNRARKEAREARGGYRSESKPADGFLATFDRAPPRRDRRCAQVIARRAAQAGVDVRRRRARGRVREAGELISLGIAVHIRRGPSCAALAGPGEVYVPPATVARTS